MPQVNKYSRESNIDQFACMTLGLAPLPEEQKLKLIKRAIQKTYKNIYSELLSVMEKDFIFPHKKFLALSKSIESYIVAWVLRELEHNKKIGDVPQDTIQKIVRYLYICAFDFLRYKYMEDIK